MNKTMFKKLFVDFSAKLTKKQDDVTWTTLKGEIMSPSDMGNEHLLNNLRVLEERLDNSLRVWAVMRLEVKKRKLTPKKLRTPEELQKKALVNERKYMNAMYPDDTCIDFMEEIDLF